MKGKTRHKHGILDKQNEENYRVIRYKDNRKYRE